MLLKDNSLDRNPWITCVKPIPTAAMRLICFPYAGGGASIFSQWSKALPPSVELWAIQLPGRETRLRETPYRRFSSLLEDLAEVLLPHLDEKPFAFFGHSLGALISFEMTRYLCRQAAAQPVHLFVSGRRPPHLPNSQLPLSHLPDDAFIRGVQQRYGGIPAIILQEPELLNLFLPILKADFELLESYHYVDDRPMNCSISAFGGNEDNQATELELTHWQHHTHQAFNLTMLPGSHFFIQSARIQLIQALTPMLTLSINQTV